MAILVLDRDVETVRRKDAAPCLMPDGGTMITKSVPEATAPVDWLSAGLVPRATGHLALLRTLRQWGVTCYAGVNGGGVIHVTKHLEPLETLDDCRDGVPRLLTMSEYVAGFVPLGYHLASAGVAAAVATTGAAGKLLAAGLTDAKLHNIPAVYLFALNAASSLGLAPLQDVSEDGMNLVDQLAAELGDGCIVLDDLETLAKRLWAAQEVLAQSRPVALCFRPDALAGLTDIDVPWVERTPIVTWDSLDSLVQTLRAKSPRQRIVLYVGEEAARYPDMPALTTLLAEQLQAPTVWSVNGANGVSATNRFGLGHIQFGGNDRAVELWRTVGPDDIVIMVGFDPGEYCLNLEPIRAGLVWHLTALPDSYGSRKGSFRHRVHGLYQQVQGDLVQVLEALLARLDRNPLSPRPTGEPLPALNTASQRPAVAPGCVDLVQLYESLGRRWQPRSIGFDDVCVAYRDRPYVMQRPHPNIRFYTAYQGSAMGGAFGLGVGARLADPDLHTFVFSGDGCWRLFGSSLAEAAGLDLRLFIFNNGTYGLVDTGLDIAIPTLPRRYHHAELARVDFVAAARAHGWDAFRLDADLSNLGDVMDACYARRGRSLLVDVPVDPHQVLGTNPRARRL